MRKPRIPGYLALQGGRLRGMADSGVNPSMGEFAYRPRCRRSIVSRYCWSLKYCWISCDSRVIDSPSYLRLQIQIGESPGMHDDASGEGFLLAAERLAPPSERQFFSGSTKAIPAIASLPDRQLHRTERQGRKRAPIECSRGSARGLEK